VQEQTEGAEINDNLDALSGCVDRIPFRHRGSQHRIPASWSSVSKLKTAADSKESLLGPPAVAAQRQLLSIPVAVAATVPDDLLLVVDRRAILSAYG